MKKIQKVDRDKYACGVYITILRLWCSSNWTIDFQGLNFFFIRKKLLMMWSMTVFRHLQNIELKHLPRCLSDGKRNNLSQKNNIVDL